MALGVDQDFPAAEWVPTLVVLPFRELGTFEDHPGITAAEWLTLRLSSTEAFRILDPDMDRDILREVEIGLFSGQTTSAPQREGVDGVVTGDIIVHQDQWILTAKLTSLADESVYGIWTEAPIAEGLKRALDDMTDQLALKVAAWGKTLKTQHARKWKLQQENLSALGILTGKSVVVDIQESYSRDHRLLAGFSEGAILGLCAKADLMLRIKDDLAAGLLPAGTVIVRGEATCDEPVHRDGRAVATAMCKLGLYRPDSQISLAEATVCRTFAAGLAREAGTAALESAGRDAFLQALDGLQRSSNGLSGDTAQNSAHLKSGSPSQHQRPRKPVCLEIVDTGDPSLIAIREILLLMLTCDSNLRPMIRTLYDPAQPYSASAGPSVADLRRPASHAIILAREANILWGRILDTRTGELLAAHPYPLGTSLVAATDELVQLFRRATERTTETRLAQWIRTVGSPLFHDILLRQSTVRVIPAEYERILLQERGLGQEAAPFAWDMILRNETFSGREKGIDGATVRIVADGPDGKILGEGSVFLANGSSFQDRQKRLSECIAALLPLSETRPAREGTVSAGKQKPPEVLAFAKAESESQRIVDWYRTHGGDDDDTEPQALEILAKPCAFRSGYNAARTWHGPATRAASARLRWEIANKRLRNRRSADRWFVYRAWAHWREVPRSDAEALTDAYLRAYYTRDDDSDPANPDLLLTFQIIETCHMPGLDRWQFRERIPTFRQNDFRQALARSGASATHRLASEEWPMLCAIWRRDVVSPEEHGPALVKALSTTNSLSRLLRYAHATPNFRASGDEGELINVIEDSVRRRVEPNPDEADSSFSARSAAKFHAALAAYVTSSPRPLPPLILWAARNVSFPKKEHKLVFRAALREVDGIRPSYVSVTPQPTVFDGHFGPSDWPVEWLPCPLEKIPDVRPVLEWVNNEILYQALLKQKQYKVKVPFLTVIGCNIRTAQWAVDANFGDVLAQASAVQVIRREAGEGYAFFRVNGRSYLTTPWKTWRVEPNGELTDHALLPPCGGKWEILLECGNGVVFAERAKARLRYWDATTDSIVDLANHASTEPGPLNNQSSWQVRGLHPGSLPGLCAVVVQAIGPLANGRGSGPVLRHISMDCTTRKAVLMGRIDGSSSVDHKSFSTPDALFVHGWYRFPRDSASPPLKLAGTATASSIAASAQRAFSNRQYGSTAERLNLNLHDDFTGDSPRVVAVKEKRIQTPKLLRIGDDLVLFNRINEGIRIIRDAFTRALPPDGSDIQLREVEFHKSTGIPLALERDLP